MIVETSLQGTLVHRTYATEDHTEAKIALLEGHWRHLMRAILSGFAGTAPRSVTPNLIELLSIMLPRCPGDNRKEITDILYAVRDIATIIDPFTDHFQE